MAVDRTPVLKRCRSLGIDPIVMGINKTSKRQPHGNPRRQVSEYGQQLREKQKAKFIYGVLEKQFHKYYVEAVRKPGVSGDNLMIELETRLDNVVFRLGFAHTRREARQAIDHGHVMVNGRIVHIPSFQVRAGDVVALTPKAKDMLVTKSALVASESRQVPSWLDVNLEKLQGTVISRPSRDQIDMDIQASLIIELYSK